MINFVKKEKRGGKIVSKHDVSVTYSFAHGKTGQAGKSKTLRFSFSEKAVKMICGEGRYALAGIDKDFPDRIYFCSADETNGYRMSRGDKRGQRYTCTFGSGTHYTNATDFIGLYNLEYDAKQGALYINKKNKKGE